MFHEQNVKNEVSIPLIDMKIPEVLETATFALG
jgi:hypothetical protein